VRSCVRDADEKSQAPWKLRNRAIREFARRSWIVRQIRVLGRPSRRTGMMLQRACTAKFNCAFLHALRASAKPAQVDVTFRCVFVVTMPNRKFCRQNGNRSSSTPPPRFGFESAIADDVEASGFFFRRKSTAKGQPKTETSATDQRNSKASASIGGRIRNAGSHRVVARKSSQ